MHRDIHAGLLNAALQRGYKPPSGEVWSADMLKPDYKAKPAASNDLGMLRSNMAKMKQQAAQFSPEGRELRKTHIAERKITMERRRVADQMKKDGADPKRVRDFLLTGA